MSSYVRYYCEKIYDEIKCLDIKLTNCKESTYKDTIVIYTDMFHIIIDYIHPKMIIDILNIHSNIKYRFNRMSYCFQTHIDEYSHIIPETYDQSDIIVASLNNFIFTELNRLSGQYS